MFSTRDMASFPDPQHLIKITRSLAMLDAILCEDWEGRYYSFNSHWHGTKMASMRNGSGDEYFIWFSEGITAIKGFAHEAYMSPRRHGGKIFPGVFDGLPPELEPFLNEPAFSRADTTFCVWRRPADAQWQSGDIAWPTEEQAGGYLGVYDPDGSAALLGILDGSPDTYHQWAIDYYELDDENLDVSDVARVYEHEKLTAELLERMGCSRSLSQLDKDIREIGYPR